MKTVCRLLLALLLLSAVVTQVRAQKPPPNVVLILADDMGWGDLNINGNMKVETPAINKMASQSLSFDRFYVCPLCAPTRSEMLTGRYFLRTGVSSVAQGYENMRTEEVTIAEILKKNGYNTGCFGKWHNGGYFLQHPNRQGFDKFVGFCVGHLGYYFDATYLNNDDEIKSSGYSSDYFTDKALEFIKENRDNPFFCYVAYNVPHSPFQVPEKYFRKYNSRGLDNILSSVYGMVENMDDNIARILLELDTLNIRKNTIVIFFSDNGPNTVRFNGEMKGIKGSVNEGGVHLPFYISWPGVIKPGSSPQLSQDIDILPTLLGLCKIKYDAVNPLDGKDLTSIITGKEKPFDRYIFSRQANQPLSSCSGAVRNDRYRLVVTGRDTTLYDMNSDPSQEFDISLKNKKTTSELLSVYKAWEKELLNNYRPATMIEAGFPGEKKITLPVQDAILGGKIKFSSIYPNQAHTENWSQDGDSVFWKIDMKNAGAYRVDLQYGCSAGETGSRMLFFTRSESMPFTIETPFESLILPDRDYVRRGESVERTWTWMTIGTVTLNSGPETLGIKLLKKVKDEAGLIKAIRLVRLCYNAHFRRR